MESVFEAYESMEPSKEGNNAVDKLQNELIELGLAMNLKYASTLQSMEAKKHQRSPLKSDFELTTTSENRKITSENEQLVIKNTSDKQLKNIRIVASKLGSIFIPDISNIKSLAPNESITIQLVPKIDSSKYSPKDYMGGIIVVADNGLPQVIPIHIVGAERKDSGADPSRRRTPSNGDFLDPNRGGIAHGS